MKVLFVYNHPDPFILLDREILSEKWDVADLHHSKRVMNVKEVYKKVKESDLVFGWFASWHTFLPFFVAKWLNKPSVLIIGGYDLANIPSIGYGHQRGGLRKFISQWTMHFADRLITNSYFSQKEACINTKLSGRSVQVIHHGVPDPFQALPGKKSNLVLTVGNVERSNVKRKGHELFVEAAKFLPDVDFVHVGAWRDETIDYLRQISPPNVDFTGWVEKEMLIQHFQKSSVYVQASLHEGFGMSVAEAMLAGCIPVVSKNGALPEVVNGCGVLLEENTPAEIAKGICTAMKASMSDRISARETILNNFPIGKRASALTNSIQGLVAN